MPPKKATKEKLVSVRPTRAAKQASKAKTTSLYKKSNKKQRAYEDSEDDDGTNDDDEDFEQEQVRDEDEIMDFDDEDDVVRESSEDDGGSSDTFSALSSEPSTHQKAEKVPVIGRLAKKTASISANKTPASKAKGTKRKSQDPAPPTPATSNTKGLPRTPSSLKIVLPSAAPSTSSSALAGRVVADDDPWPEKYAPETIADVAVHKMKVSQVREWLQKYTDPKSFFHSVGGAILVLSGPAGSGKTTTLKLLAKEMGLEIIEWVNSVNANNIIHRTMSLDEEYTPVMRAFQEFFARAHRFTPLQSSSNGAAAQEQQQQHQAPRGSKQKKNIILIEDLPPVSAFSSRKIFQDTIATFASGNSTSSVLVVIVSDVYSKQSTELLFSNNENRDSALTVRTLFPPYVLGRLDQSLPTRQCPNIKHIKFNPIASTLIKKAVTSLVKQEFVKKNNQFKPDEEELDEIMQIHEGDIRAVMNALHFHCQIPYESRRKYRKSAKMALDDAAGLHVEGSLVEGQDSSLSIFQAVGRVLYNKRAWSGGPEEFDKDIVKTPGQGMSKLRPPLTISPERDVMEKLPVEPDLFTLMLHQNYTQHLSTAFECNTAMEYLCLSDLFTSQTNSNFTQMIQLQPYMTSLAVRGLLFAPERAGPSTAGPKKQRWPEMFAHNRIMRANDQSYAVLAAGLAGEEDEGQAAGHLVGPGFFPKAVIRHELAPMLHKCYNRDRSLPIFQMLAGSVPFLKDSVGRYGFKVGIVHKDFGEGEDGFLEDGVADEEISVSTPSPPLPGRVGSQKVVAAAIGTSGGHGRSGGMASQQYQQPTRWSQGSPWRSTGSKIHLITSPALSSLSTSSQPSAPSSSLPFSRNNTSNPYQSSASQPFQRQQQQQHLRSAWSSPLSQPPQHQPAQRLMQHQQQQHNPPRDSFGSDVGIEKVVKEDPIEDFSD